MLANPPGQKSRWAVFGAWFALVFLSACGSSGVEISLIASESREDAEAYGFAIAGEDVTEGAPTITVQAGEEVTLTLENVHGQYHEGPAAVHDLAILPDTPENRKFPPHGPEIKNLVLWDVVFLGNGTGLFPGETETISFVPDAPGTYIYVCTVPGHGGQVGEFIVEGN